MSNTVFCRKYQKELEALPFPPLPGKQGQEIQATVSKPACSPSAMATSPALQALMAIKHCAW